MLSHTPFIITLKNTLGVTSPCWRNNFVLSLLLLLLLNVSAVVAQEAPYFETKYYDPFHQHRQNVCDRQVDIFNGKVELRDALQGLELHPIIGVGSFFQLNNGTIDPDNPGLLTVLLDEISLRAGFTWRQSYAIYTGTGGEEYSWMDLLIWATDAYDVVIDWWASTPERMGMGVVFPRGFYDSSFIIVGRKMEPQERGHLFSWLHPFSASVWFAIIATTVLSAFIMMLLEKLNRSKEDNNWQSPVRSLFFSFMVLMQNCEFLPEANGARIFVVTFVYFSLMIEATYTANLASSFVEDQVPPQINGIEAAVEAGLPICVVQDWPSTAYVTKQFPTGVYIERESEEDSFLGLKNGDCDFVLTNVNLWRQLQMDYSVNGDCDLEWVGWVIKYVEAGFAIRGDRNVKCTGLIQDVMHLHLMEMIYDGFIDRAWEVHFQRNQDVNCDSMITEHIVPELSLNEMSGVFLLLFIGATLALFLTLFKRMKARYEMKHIRQEALRRSIRVNRDIQKEVLRRSMYTDVTSNYRNNMFPPSRRFRPNRPLPALRESISSSQSGFSSNDSLGTTPTRKSNKASKKTDHAIDRLQVRIQLMQLSMDQKTMEQNYLKNRLEQKQQISQISAMLQHVVNARKMKLLNSAPDCDVDIDLLSDPVY